VLRQGLIGAAVAGAFYGMGQLANSGGLGSAATSSPQAVGISPAEAASSSAVDLTKSINVGTVYTSSAATNALVFDDVVKLETFVVYSSRELGYLGGNSIVESLAASGTIAAFNVDTLRKGADMQKAINDAVGDRKFKNIVLERHGGIDGWGDARMLSYYDPASPLMKALVPHLGQGGNVWLNWCYGGSFVATNPTYLAQVSQLFGGATVYYGTGIQQIFNGGLASAVTLGDGGFISNRFLDYQSFSPNP
jgi:hypothetical protein